MANSPHIFEVGRDDFGARVLERSREVPVLVDFWAPWCAPCQMLAPVLERIVQGYPGRVELGKVNTDVEQELALRYRVRGLPTVKLFRDAMPVDEFMGLQPESAIRLMLERHLPSAAGGLLEQAHARFLAGEAAQARKLLEQALALDPGNDAAKTELARLHALAGELEAAQRWLDALSAPARLQPQARAVAALLRFARLCAAAPSRGELEESVSRRPDDCRAREQLAARAVLERDYEPALQQLLEIVKRDRGYGDDAGRRDMLAVFDLLGGQGELVNRYRYRLSTAIN